MKPSKPLSARIGQRKRDAASSPLFRGCLVFALGAVLGGLVLGLAACDTSDFSDDQGSGGIGGGGGSGGGGGGGGGGGLTQPILFNLNQGDENLIVGKVISLIGVNFSADLSANRVTFRSGRSTISGTPVAVFFPVDNNAADGQDSRLLVLVPSGVLTGSIELEVGGIFAGAVGYNAGPMILGYTIGSGNQPGNFASLQHNGILGFDPTLGPETILVHGLNFDDVTEIFLEDDSRNTVTLTLANFQRRRLMPDNGTDTLMFSLQGVRLGLSPTQPTRGSIRVVVATSAARSNLVAVPVRPIEEIQDPLSPMGPAINHVIMPLGARTGLVRFSYNFYDSPISVPYQMIVEWSVNDTDWFRAATPANGVDPLNDGDLQVVPGHIGFGPQVPLVRGGGTLRDFTWDSVNDASFRALNLSSGTGGSAAPRNWAITFRIQAQPMDTEGGVRFNPGILFVTPAVAFVDVQDRPGDADDAILDEGRFLEEFETTTNRESVCRDNQDPLVDQCTSALWGPPFNVGNVEGSISVDPPLYFGDGTFSLRMDLLEDPTVVTREFYRIDTSRMQIDRLIDEQGDVISFPVFPNIQQGLENPGAAAGEFHVKEFIVPAGVVVECEGNRPLVMRLSGTGDPLEPVCQIDGDILANGQDGGDAVGGVGVLGSGAGGAGGVGSISAQAAYTLARSTPGGLGGGGAGDSPMAVGPDLRQLSRVLGAPGGGGGARLRGGSGESGAPSPTLYRPARAGLGGTQRGSEKLLRPVPGSGGGGGGVGITRPPNATTPIDQLAFANGGGGGSGGGAIQISGDGSITITGTIQCNGGAGFTTARNSGPGGGGSGGSILIEASGIVSVSCDNLQVEGGAAGTASTMNATPGSGAGSPGWVRVNSGGGGLPFCALLSLETTLTERLSTSLDTNLTIRVQDATAFPDVGTIVIDREIIRYDRKTGNSFTRLTRGLDGTTVATHEVGAVVALDAAVFPGVAISESGGLVPSPDRVDTLNGLDGSLHCFFLPSVDPGTGEPVIDRNGRIQSVWVIDTDTGTVTDPRGAIIKVGIGSTIAQPGVLQLTSLRIDAGVTLRGVGRNALELVVTDNADIDGIIDVSGDPGGILSFDTNDLKNPSPGLGGAGGAGGGHGGLGGTIEFVNGSSTDKSIENVQPIPGQPGTLPRALVEGPSTPLPLDSVSTPTGGNSQRDASCESPTNTCTATAGGGGGGGHLEGGQDGTSQPPGINAGVGGTPVGTPNFRSFGQIVSAGGTGGAGGGASAALSAAYKNGTAGNSIFRSQANYGPGTGGGGGGGFLRLTVGGELILRSGGGLRANGGDAFQSIDLAGNGGAGAGGGILIQVLNALTLEAGARITAFGGLANQPVPVPAGQTLPPYEGNVRGGVPFGGLGGSGAPGRIRIEAPLGSGSLQAGRSDNFFAGDVLPDVERSFAYSIPLRLGVGPGSAVLTRDIDFNNQTVLFSSQGPSGSVDSEVLWESAYESTTFYGQTTGFTGGIRDAGGLLFPDYYRFQIIFLSNYFTFETPRIRRISATYSLR